MPRGGWSCAGSPCRVPYVGGLRVCLLVCRWTSPTPGPTLVWVPGWTDVPPTPAFRQQRPESVRRLHSAHRGLFPVPSRRFSDSMLLPVLQFVQTWCTSCFVECQGDFFMGFSMVTPDCRVSRTSREGTLAFRAPAPTDAVALHLHRIGEEAVV